MEVKKPKMPPYGGTMFHMALGKLEMPPYGGTMFHMALRKLEMPPYGGTMFHIFQQQKIWKLSILFRVQTRIP